MRVTDEAEETSTSDSSAAAAAADAAAAVRVLVFVVYKKEAIHVANGLCDQGFAAEALQGDMSQRKRCASCGRCDWFVATERPEPGDHRLSSNRDSIGSTAELRRMRPLTQR
jgi:hypothetical protein